MALKFIFDFASIYIGVSCWELTASRLFPRPAGGCMRLAQRFHVPSPQHPSSLRALLTSLTGQLSSQGGGPREQWTRNSVFLSPGLQENEGQTLPAPHPPPRWAGPRGQPCDTSQCLRLSPSPSRPCWMCPLGGMWSIHVCDSLCRARHHHQLLVELLPWS